MKKTAFATVACVLLVSACVETTTMASNDMGDAGSLTARLSGKTLTNDRGGMIVLGADGSMSGTVEGAWTERDGQFCRTVTAPARLAGTLCQDVRFNADGTVSFLQGATGTATWEISS